MQDVDVYRTAIIKKEYMKPPMKAIELQHMTRLLVGSGDVRGLRSSGWNDTVDELNLSDQGGGSSTQSARVKSYTVDWDDDWSE